MSTREESYSGYPMWILPLTGGDAPEPDGHPNAVRIYADENQDLRTIKSDGTDAPIGGGGSSAVQSASVTLTDDQIKTLPTVAVELVAAPGMGQMILPVCAMIVFNFPDGTYAGGVGDYGTIGTGLDEAELIQPIPIPSGSNGAVRTFIPQQLYSGTPSDPIFPQNQTVSDLDNAALTISASTSGSNWTGGGAGNSLLVTVLYIVQATS